MITTATLERVNKLIEERQNLIEHVHEIKRQTEEEIKLTVSFGFGSNTYAIDDDELAKKFMDDFFVYIAGKITDIERAIKALGVDYGADYNLRMSK